MNIGIVCYPTFGGSGVVATELGLELSKRGHTIHFITYKQPVRLELLSRNVFFHEVHVPEYPLFHYQPYELALSSKLVDMIQLHNIELLHVHYAIPHAYAAYMAQQMLKAKNIHLPIVTTLHGTDITLVGNHPFYKPAVTFSINKSDAVTSVSESLKNDTLRLFDIEKPIHVIPNFIDNSKYDSTFTDCQRFIMAKPDERIITHISNFREVKQIPDVIKIFYNIQKEIPAKLMMVGEGPKKEDAEYLVGQLDIKDKVVFFGNSNEIDKILCFSDLFLLPSLSESFGLAALEAMANSVPVISTNTGGLPEVNKHGFSGYLSEVNDVEDMSNNALKILKSNQTLDTFKVNAKVQSQTFDLKNIVPMYEHTYEDTLKGMVLGLTPH